MWKITFKLIVFPCSCGNLPSAPGFFPGSAGSNHRDERVNRVTLRFVHFGRKEGFVGVVSPNPRIGEK